MNNLDSNDPLARFLTSKNHYSRQNNRVRANAFLPPADRKLSVFQIKELAETEIWRIGETCISQPTGRTLHGRADISVLSVHNVDLKIDPNNKPPRHANIIGWPEEKSKQKLFALELAAKATLKLKPQ